MMKTLALLVVLASGSTALASEGAPSVDTGSDVSASVPPGSPFNVAHLAYRGAFRAQGIASYTRFCHDYIASRKIDARKVADAAIEAGAVDESQVTKRYLTSLHRQIWSLCRSGR